jgi:hypothetical protein
MLVFEHFFAGIVHMVEINVQLSTGEPLMLQALSLANLTRIHGLVFLFLPGSAQFPHLQILNPVTFPTAVVAFLTCVVGLNATHLTALSLVM